MIVYNHQNYLFSLLYHVLWSFVASIGIGVVAGTVVWRTEKSSIFLKFIDAYFVTFNCVITTGLAIGVVYFIWRTQYHIIDVIEKTFDTADLQSPDFQENKGRFLNYQRSAIFSGNFIIIAFVIFFFAGFKFQGFPQYVLIGVGCAQYGLGVYVGRKLFYFAKILNSVENLKPKVDVFNDEKLGLIASYVNIASTLTLIFVYTHVKSFYYGPFDFQMGIGNAAKQFFLLPAIIATPVLVIFNFYPRGVLRTLYTRSIEEKLADLTKKLGQQNNITLLDRLKYIADREKMSREEMRYRLQLSLSDIPIGLAIFTMIFSLIRK